MKLVFNIYLINVFLKKVNFTFKIVVFCFLFGFNPAKAQTEAKISTEIGGYVGSSNSIPFWHNVNQFGAVPNNSPALLAKIGIHSATDSTHHKHLFEFLYGFEAFGTVESKSQYNIIEANLGLRIGRFVLSVGRKKEIYGFVDTLLSTGSVAYSGNSLPIPKVQLSTNGFVDVPFTKRLFAFQGNYAHGWLGETTYSIPFRNPPVIGSDKIWLHQKSFYLRFGKPHWKLNFMGGFNHQAYWGNERSYLYIGLSDAEIYKRVVFGVNFLGSKIGNNFGTIDLGMTIKGEKWDKYIYRQSIYDTGSLLNALNLDALNGIRFRRKSESVGGINIKDILIEYLYTNDQVDPLVTQGGGYNSYFNHYVYIDGWTYKGRQLGTPMAVMNKDIKQKDLQARDNYIVNNRIYALHLATRGNYNDISFLIKGTFSKNEGTYSVPFVKPLYQFSSLIELQKPLMNRINGKISLATDIGGLYNNQMGMYFGISKRW